MYPDATLGVLAIVQQASADLLTAHEPAFLNLGRNIFTAAAVAMISWHGLSWMYMPGAAEAKSWEFARLLLQVATGLMMLVFYEAPMPGVGISFSNLITDSMAYLTSILDARGVELAFQSINDLWSRAVVPAWTNIAAMLLWFVLFLAVAAAKAATLAVVSYAFVASAVCALVGPLFLPFFIIQPLSWVFWGWLKAFVQYSFLPVIALAWITVGQRLITALVEQLPPAITYDILPLYIIQCVVVLVVFITGVVSLPFLNSALWSGHSHGGSGSGIITTMVRRGR